MLICLRTSFFISEAPIGFAAIHYKIVDVDIDDDKSGVCELAVERPPIIDCLEPLGSENGAQFVCPQVDSTRVTV